MKKYLILSLFFLSSCAKYGNDRRYQWNDLIKEKVKKIFVQEEKTLEENNKKNNNQESDEEEKSSWWFW